MILSAFTLLSVMVTTGQEPHCCGSTSPPSVTALLTSKELHLSVYSFFNKVSGNTARHLNYIKISTVLPFKKKKKKEKVFSHGIFRSKMSKQNNLLFLIQMIDRVEDFYQFFSCAYFASTLSNFSFLPNGMLHYLAIIDYITILYGANKSRHYYFYHPAFFFFRKGEQFQMLV